MQKCIVLEELRTYKSKSLKTDMKTSNWKEPEYDWNNYTDLHA